MMRIITIFIFVISFSVVIRAQIFELDDFPNYRINDVEVLNEENIILGLGPLNRQTTSFYYEFLMFNVNTNEYKSFLKLNQESLTRIVNVFIETNEIHIIGIKGTFERKVFRYIYNDKFELISFEESENFIIEDPVDFLDIKLIDNTYYLTGVLFAGFAFVATYDLTEVKYKLITDNFISNDIQVFNDSIYILGDFLSVMDRNLENIRKIDQPCRALLQGHLLFNEDKMFFTGARTVFGDPTSVNIVTCGYDAYSYELLSSAQLDGENTALYFEKASVSKNLEQTISGDLLIGGTSSPDPANFAFTPLPTSLLIAKYNTDLDLLCQNEFFFKKGAFMFSITAGKFGKNYIGGSLYDAETDTATPLLIQVDDDCLFSATETILLEESAIELYPNPVLDELHINAASDTDVTKIIIYDIDGSVVKHYNYFSNTLDVSDLVSGIYTMALYTQDGIITKRVVVMD